MKKPLLLALLLVTSACAAAREVTKPSPLESVLNIFVSDNGAWGSFKKASGVQWIDSAPSKVSESSHKERSYSEKGKLLLNGFETVDMPNGKVGIDFRLVKANEGNAIVTLNGDVDRVHSISLTKFYPRENYPSIIREQLQEGSDVKLIADHCELDEYGADANTAKTTFYEIHLAAGTVYAQVSVDEGGVSTASASALGYTMFDFYRNKPEQQIKKMQCHML